MECDTNQIKQKRTEHVGFNVITLIKNTGKVFVRIHKISFVYNILLAQLAIEQFPINSKIVFVIKKQNWKVSILSALDKQRKRRKIVFFNLIVSRDLLDFTINVHIELMMWLQQIHVCCFSIDILPQDIEFIKLHRASWEIFFFF